MKYIKLYEDFVNENLNEVLAATDSKKLTNRVEITAPIARTLMNNAMTGKLKRMSAPDGVSHYWNPKTKEYIGKTKQEGRFNQGTYFFSDALDKEGNLVESVEILDEANETGFENLTDDQLKAKFTDYERRKHDLGAQAAKDFIDLKKEISKRNL